MGGAEGRMSGNRRLSAKFDRSCESARRAAFERIRFSSQEGHHAILVQRARAGSRAGGEWMIRVNTMRAVLVLMLATGALRAQNSDLGVLLGFSGPTSRVDAGTGLRIFGSVGASGQINYASQLRETSAGRIYLELPLLLGAHVSGTVAGNVIGSAGGMLFFTPGVRWNILPHSRISFYATGGAGMAAFNENRSVVASDSISIRERWTLGPAVGFGGGLDLRLTRLMSLRAEARDFVTTAKGLGGVEGHHHPVYGIGLGFHW